MQRILEVASSWINQRLSQDTLYCLGIRANWIAWGLLLVSVHS